MLFGKYCECIMCINKHSPISCIGTFRCVGACTAVNRPVFIRRNTLLWSISDDSVAIQRTNIQYWARYIWSPFPPPERHAHLKINFYVHYAVEQLVETLRYKPEGRGFDSQWYNWNWHNPSGCTVALGSTQPLTEMSTSNISWVVKAAGA